jgi:hypothetical protein
MGGSHRETAGREEQAQDCYHRGKRDQNLRYASQEKNSLDDINTNIQNHCHTSNCSSKAHRPPARLAQQTQNPRVYPRKENRPGSPKRLKE